MPLKDIEKFSHILIDQITTQPDLDQQTSELAVQDAIPDFTTQETAEDISNADINIPQHINDFLDLLKLSVVPLEFSLTEMLLFVTTQQSVGRNL